MAHRLAGADAGIGSGRRHQPYLALHERSPTNQCNRVAAFPPSSHSRSPTLYRVCTKRHPPTSPT